MKLLATAIVIGWMLLGTSANAGPQRELNVGVTHDQYQDHFDAQVKREYRLIDIACYPVVTQQGRERHFNVHSVQIWEDRPSPIFRAQAGYVDAERVRADTEKLARSGFRMIGIGATVSGNKLWHSVIWEQRPDVQLEYRWDVTARQLDKDGKSLAGEGYQPVCLSAVQADGKLKFTGAWEKRQSPEREIQIGITTRRILQDIAQRRKDGFRVFDVNAYQQGRNTRVACIWEKSTIVQEARVVTADKLPVVNKEFKIKGFVPAQVTVFLLGVRPQILCIWERD